MGKKRLTKSQKDRKIFGVCGGIANYLDIDPTLIRLIWAGSIICFGVGGVAYLVAALILPDENSI